MSNRSTKTAFGGIITALSTLLILMSSFISVLSYVLSAISGLLILLCAMETGYRRGWMAFVSTSLISFLLSVDKSAVILFVLILGYYPMLKFKIESMKQIRIIKIILKILIFNIAVISEYFITIKLFNVPEEALVWFGVPMPLVMLVVGNFTFLMYDRAITNLSYIYFYRYRKKLRYIAKLD